MHFLQTLGNKLYGFVRLRKEAMSGSCSASWLTIERPSLVWTGIPAVKTSWPGEDSLFYV